MVHLMLKDVLDALNSGKDLEDLCKELSVDSKEIVESLKTFGYRFDESTKKWINNSVQITRIKHSKKQHEHVVVLPRWINEQLEQFAKKTSFDKNTLIKLAVLEFIEKHTN